MPGPFLRARGAQRRSRCPAGSAGPRHERCWWLWWCRFW